MSTEIKDAEEWYEQSQRTLELFKKECEEFYQQAFGDIKKVIGRIEEEIKLEERKREIEQLRERESYLEKELWKENELVEYLNRVLEDYISEPWIKNLLHEEE